MTGFLVSAAIGVLFVSFAVTAVLACYFTARRFLQPGAEGDRTHDAAAAVAVRIAALHGLILALVYAQELDDYKGVRATLIDESVAVADIYNDIRRYGGSAVEPVQAGLANYLWIVVNEEWDMLGRKQGLSPNAWAQWEEIYNNLLDLTPHTPREQHLSGRMLGRVSDIAKFRQMREATSYAGFSELFWAPAIIGLVLLAAPFYVYRPSRTHLLLLSLFGAYSGVILFFIYAFSNPFEQPGKMEPMAFERLLQTDIGKSLPPPPG